MSVLLAQKLVLVRGHKWRPVGDVTPPPPGEEEPPPDEEEPPPPPPPDPPSITYDRILANETITGYTPVPLGEVWLVGEGVIAHECNLVVFGTLDFVPGSHIYVTGGNPDNYVGNSVGNGLRYGPEYANDFGLWVENEGLLRINGTPKAGWNYTGTDATWESTDEYWIAPSDLGDWVPRRWYLGDPIPTVTGTNPRTSEVYTFKPEVANVTRDILIQCAPGATWHIHIHAHDHPQEIKYIRLDGLGVSNLAHEGPVTGRYALHLHHSSEDSAGHEIEGVSITNAKGRCLVPHGSYGVTFTDCVVVNAFADGFWWDANNESDRSTNITVDHVCVMGVAMPRAVSGKTSSHSCFTLPGGENMTMINCAASGARNSGTTHGFSWPSAADNFGTAVWIFNNNIAHNVAAVGIRLWFNNPNDHQMLDSVSYRCGKALSDFTDTGRLSAGTEALVNGAYRNAHTWQDIVVLDSNINLHASGQSLRDDPTRGPIFRRIVVLAKTGQIACTTGGQNVAALFETLVDDCVFQSGGVDLPSVVVGSAKMENPSWIRFRECYNGAGVEMTPDDLELFVNDRAAYGTVGMYPEHMAGTEIYMEHSDGREWLITPDMVNTLKIVTLL